MTYPTETEHAGNILSQHTDKVMSYIPTTALATSSAHSTGSVLPYSACTVPHLFQSSACNVSSNAVSLRWLCQAYNGRKQLHPSNLLPATCAHCIVSQSSAILSRITKHKKQGMLQRNSGLHAHLPHEPEVRNTNCRHFEKMPNGSYPGRWI